jgi:cystathionine gamma-synthase
MTHVDRSTIWPYDAAGEPREFFYARYGHPTGAAAEARLGQLEGGDALLFASGMGAETAVLLALAEPGTTVALAEGAYYGTSVLMRELVRWGLRFVEYDQTGAPPDAQIVWVESPANPLLTVPDWEALRAHPGRVVCDATVSTPVYLRALEEGADVVVHSATKFLNGSHNALLGATVTRDPELSSRLRDVRGRAGIQASPDSAGQLLRGLDSLERRMRRITASATELARRLGDHPSVEHVRYPGFSGLISFDVARPREVETRLQVITNATSLGGVNSTLESRHRWEGDRIPRGLLRLSVGLEDVQVLWRDLEQALRAS